MIKITKYNKWDLIDKVLGSTLGEDNKLLLIELVRRCNYEEHRNWDCWPSVQRLAQVRGMKNERHFKGVDVYLPGLVDKRKRGRKNVYTVNPEAIMELEQFETIIKHTPAPAVNTPALEANTPAVEGANSTVDSTLNSTLSAAGASDQLLIDLNDKEEALAPDPLIGSTDAAVPIEGTTEDTPAPEGVLNPDDYYEWNGRMVLRAGAKGFDQHTQAAPVEPEVKCSNCKKHKVFHNDLCWDCAE